jgi:hypothetical protein
MSGESQAKWGTDRGVLITEIVWARASAEVVVRQVRAQANSLCYLSTN